MPEFSLGSKEYLENILGKRGPGNSRERKLPGVLLYLYVNSTQTLQGLKIGKEHLRPFLFDRMNGTNPNRYNLLYALDSKESLRQDAPIKVNLRISCICIEYETSGYLHGSGTPIARVRLLQQDIVVALRMLGEALSLSWKEVLECVGCDEEDLQSLQKRKSEASQNSARAIHERLHAPHTRVKETRLALPTVVSQQDTSSVVAQKGGQEQEEVGVPPRLPQNAKSILAQVQHMKNIPLQTGRGEDVRWQNLRVVLAELYRIQQDGVVTGQQLGNHKNRISGYLTELSDACCVELVYGSGGRGRPGIQTIRLLKREVPKPQKKVFSSKAVEKNIPHFATLKPPSGFLLVSEREWQILKEGAITKDTRDDKRIAFVFMDSANITNEFARSNGQLARPGDGGENRLAPINEIHWERLYAFIQRGYKGHSFAIKRASVYVYKNVPFVSDVRNSLERAGFTPIMHHKPDTDVLLSNDLLLVAEAMDAHKNITLVLVSGDGDYNRGLEHLVRMARAKNVDLKIWIISWAGKINKDLEKELADHVTFFNELLSYVCPTGGQRRDERKNERKTIYA